MYQSLGRLHTCCGNKPLVKFLVKFIVKCLVKFLVKLFWDLSQLCVTILLVVNVLQSPTPQNTTIVVQCQVVGWCNPRCWWDNVCWGLDIPGNPYLCNGYWCPCPGPGYYDYSTARGCANSHWRCPQGDILCDRRNGDPNVPSSWTCPCTNDGACNVTVAVSVLVSSHTCFDACLYI